MNTRHRRLRDRGRTAVTWTWFARAACVAAAAVTLAVVTPAHALPPYDPQAPLFFEFAVGATMPGPDGTPIGSGQHYLAQLGWRTNAWSDIGVLLAFSNARDNDLAIENDITSGGARARAMLGLGRWTPYGEIGGRLYSFDTQISGGNATTFGEKVTGFGGNLGAGLLYSRSTWWIGVGAEVHSVFAEVGFDPGNQLTYATYNLIIGAPIGGGGSGGN